MSDLKVSCAKKGSRAYRKMSHHRGRIARAGASSAAPSVERTLREIARVAYDDPRRLFRADGALVPIVKLDEDAAGTIAAIEVDEDGRTTRVRMWEKNRALEMAMRHLGLYERNNEQLSESLALQAVLVK
jgi:phage terminase small subunit